MLKTITSTYQLPNNLSIGLDRTDLYITGCSPRTKTLTWNRVQLTKRKRNVLFLMQATQNFQHNSLWTVSERIQQHTDPIESEIQWQVSIFHSKKVQEKKLVRDDLVFKAYSTAYWLVKEKVWNPNSLLLANLPTLFGFHEMQYSAQGSIGEIFFWYWAAFLMTTCWRRYRVQIALLFLLLRSQMYLSWNITENIKTHSLWIENVLHCSLQKCCWVAVAIHHLVWSHLIILNLFLIERESKTES